MIELMLSALALLLPKPGRKGRRWCAPRDLRRVEQPSERLIPNLEAAEAAERLVPCCGRGMWVKKRCGGLSNMHSFEHAYEQGTLITMQAMHVGRDP